MHLQWLGMSCFKIQSGETTVILNPFDDSCGISMSHLKTDVVLSSESHNPVCGNIKRLSGEPFVVEHPGEYEVKKIFVFGIPAGETDQSKMTLYLLDDQEISLAFLGLLNHSLNDEQLKTMEGADVLLLPISTLTAERREKIVSQIEPRIIIPYYYKTEGVKTKLDELEGFIKEFGAAQVTPEKKVILKRKDLPAEETKIILLEP